MAAATALGARADAPAGSARLRRSGGRIGVLALVLLIAGLIGLPLYELQRRAFADGAAGYRVALDSPHFVDALTTTLWLAAGSTLIALILGIGLAWAAVRLPRGLGFLAVVPVIPIVIPAVASVTGWVFLFSPRIGYGNQLLRILPWWSDLRTGPANVFSLPWIVLVTGLGLTSFVYLFVAAGLRNINSETLEAARVSGSTTVGAFFRVALPLLRPSVIYATSVCLLLALGQFTGPLLLGRGVGVRVLTTEMFTYTSSTPVDYGAAAAVASPLVLFGIVFVGVQQFLLADQNRFVSHGGKAFRSIGKPSRLAAPVIVAYGFVSAVLPLAALTVVAISPFWNESVSPSDFTLRHIREALDNPRITGALRNSLTYSLWGIAITLPLTYLIAAVIVRGSRYRILRRVLDLLVAVPLGIPAVIFGAGFLFAYSRPPLNLYGTKWVVLVVYTTLMIPFGTRLLLSGMISLGSAHTEASRVSGGGVLRSNILVTIPMMRSAIGGAAALMFILLSHEFAGSLLVRSPSTNVMGTVLFDAYFNGSYSAVAVMALLMSIITTIGLCVALLVGGRRSLEAL